MAGRCFYKAFAEIVASGRIGVAHEFLSTICGPSGYTLRPDQWRHSNEEAPLLPFTQMGIVAIDICLSIWGAPKSVTAMMTRRNSNSESPDIGGAIAQYADGRMFILSTSYVSYNAYWMTVSGSKGRVKWDRKEANTVATDTAEGCTTQTYGAGDEQALELADLAACVRTGAETGAGATSIYRAAEFYRAVQESIDAGCVAGFRDGPITAGGSASG